MNLQTFVVRGIAAQAACDAIISLTAKARVTSEDLRRAEIMSWRRSMRVWALCWRTSRSRDGQCNALFKAVGCRERANALERKRR